MKNVDKEASIVILTLNAGKTIQSLLSQIDTIKYELIVIDSSSSDDTLKYCKNFNCKIVTIDKSDFNHGVTREFGRKLCNTDIVVQMTQDALPNKDTIRRLIEPIQQKKSKVSYARQIPKKGAGIMESFPREFNFPIHDQLRSIKDINKYGVYTFFCSDSCAAWSSSALDEIGGFIPTLTNEDYFACSRLLLNGHKVAYASKAIVNHSHNYSFKEEFQRMFDTGYVRAENPWIQDAVGSASKLGAKYFKALIKKLAIEKPFLIPYAFVQTAIKYIGYKIGYNSLKLPLWFKKLCSSQKYYWHSKYYNG